jgi:hypothetical protein
MAGLVDREVVAEIAARRGTLLGVRQASETEKTSTRTRPGFALLLPLMALTGLAAGTIALLASARPVQAPGHATRQADSSPV